MDLFLFYYSIFKLFVLDAGLFFVVVVLKYFGNGAGQAGLHSSFWVYSTLDRVAVAPELPASFVIVLHAILFFFDSSFYFRLLLCPVWTV